MPHHRSRFLLTFTVCLCAFAGSASSSRAGDNDCTIAVKGDSPVVQACKQGGIKKAKLAMKELQQATLKTLKLQCDDCHKDAGGANWALAKDAPEKFQRMLQLAGVAPAKAAEAAPVKAAEAAPVKAAEAAPAKAAEAAPAKAAEVAPAKAAAPAKVAAPKGAKPAGAKSAKPAGKAAKGAKAGAPKTTEAAR